MDASDVYDRIAEVLRDTAIFLNLPKEHLVRFCSRLPDERDCTIENITFVFQQMPAIVPYFSELDYATINSQILYDTVISFSLNNSDDCRENCKENYDDTLVFSIFMTEIQNVNKLFPIH
jgi:hypothetical protein